MASELNKRTVKIKSSSSTRETVLFSDKTPKQVTLVDKTI